VIPFVILVYLENGNLGKTACVHQICFELWKTSTETLKTFDCCFGKDIMGRKEVFEWLSVFKSGMISAEDTKCLGHNSMRKT
jgi:hypothetical protein